MRENGTALVTGASGGIGLATAKALLKAGYTVYGTSRRPEALAGTPPEAGHEASARCAAGTEGLEIRFLPLDLTDEGSICELLSVLPPVDVLVNNAGASQMGAVEEVPMEKIRKLYELDLFGHIRLIQGILPGMRKKGRGMIINVGSFAELTPVPCSSVYASVKAALHVLSSGLRQEVRQFGIRVVTVAPTFVHTGIYQERLSNEKSVYARIVLNAGRVRDENIRSGSSPDVIAAKIMKIIRKKNPVSFYAAGKNAVLLTLMHRLLPEKLREAAVRRHFGIGGGLE